MHGITKKAPREQQQNTMVIVVAIVRLTTKVLLKRQYGGLSDRVIRSASCPSADLIENRKTL